MKIRVVAIIQARMGSSRLRGKSLMDINGISLLSQVYFSVNELKFIDNIIVATTNLEEDNQIEELCNELNIKCFRGDTLNVFKRFIDAISFYSDNDTIVRVTADNPIIISSIAENLYKIHTLNQNDYTCIDGLSHIVPEFIKVGALRDLQKRFILSAFEMEHVTPFFRKNLTIFKSYLLPANFEGLRKDLDRFLTIDTNDDLIRMRKLLSEVNRLDINSVYEWVEKNENQRLITQNENVVTLSGIPVGDNFPTYIIAEIGQNHNGDMIMAKKLIDMAVRCGANAVKFQKRDISSELTTEAYNRPYENSNSFGRTYGEHREFLELNEEQHYELKEYSTINGITYFCTPCDVPSVELLERIGCPFYKIASRDLTNIPLLEKLATLKKPIIMSTGMASVEDIDDALETLKLNKQDLIIMQCTSEYPCKLENVNLRAISTLKKKYGYVTGLSDHTSGVIVSAAAILAGASIIEKHITLDRTLKGTDQPGSLEESGLKKLIGYIRAIELAQGDGRIEFNPDVASAKIKLARSITSKLNILKGQILTEDMICLKSPGDGLLWRDRHQILNKKSKVNIDSGVTLKLSDFE